MTKLTRSPLAGFAPESCQSQEPGFAALIPEAIYQSLKRHRERLERRRHETELLSREELPADCDLGTDRRLTV